MRIIDFFPMPSYLKIPAIGLDISDQSLKHIELRRNGKAIEIAAYGKKEIPAGIIESGQIKKDDELISFLKDLRKEVKNNYIIISLPEEKTFIGNVRLPSMKESEIRNALELQLEEYIPLQAKDTVFDYEAVGEKGDKSYVDVSFAAVPIAIVESYGDVLKGAGFIPVVFEPEPHSLVRALIGPEEKRVQMMIDLGKTRTTFIITSGRNIELTSTIKIPGEATNSVLSNASSIKLSGVSNLKISVKNEAQKHLAYWKNHIKNKNNEVAEIERIILCGGDANLSGLPEYLSIELKVAAELGDAWLNVFSPEDYIPEIEYNESLMYATAVGLALRSFN